MTAIREKYYVDDIEQQQLTLRGWATKEDMSMVLDDLAVTGNFTAKREESNKTHIAFVCDEEGDEGACPWRLNAHLMGDARWYIRSSLKEHNHPCLPMS